MLQMRKIILVLIGLVLLGWLVFHLLGMEIGIVSGNSMLPTIKNNDMLIVKRMGCKVPFELSVGKGDIVVAVVSEREGDSVYFYRVVKRVVCVLDAMWVDERSLPNPILSYSDLSTLLVLCGDNRAATAVYVVTPHQIAGKVVAVIPYGGSVLLALLLVGTAGLLGLFTHKLIVKGRGDANATSARN